MWKGFGFVVEKSYGWVIVFDSFGVYIANGKCVYMFRFIDVLRGISCGVLVSYRRVCV